MEKSIVLTLAVLTLIVAVRAVDNENININVNVDPESKTYHQFKTREGSFNYGYNVAKKKFNQFQHKVRGPDDVTYGCYGFVDPDNGTHLYHYVSDLKGYRIVSFNQTTKIYRQRVADSVKQLLEAVEESLPWDRLYFPEVCRHLYLSQKESNQFSLPEGAIVAKDGSVIFDPSAAPAQPTFRQQPRPATPSPATPAPTPRPPAPTRGPAVEPPRYYPTSPRPLATTPRSTVAIPKQTFNDVPSKIPVKPIELKPVVKPTSRAEFGTRRPPENSILNLATSQTETVVKPNNIDRVDLIAIGQDVQDVKATLNKLITHLLSRDHDCNTPTDNGYRSNNIPEYPTSHGTGPTQRIESQPVSQGPGRPGQIAAYLPLILTDYVSGTPFAHAPSDPNIGGESVRLALPAYPIPQCPVCQGKK
ncbi:proteoglycan 4-like [Wyeomyia smithii]|uniref:proteoglycan 4-like n=1 Tax=Wyeomyia smithii TaxID=174621 RepID=UPI002467CB67|nr:proteoglycan 4-like [Wyeomyia smithii]